jgi:hypothetical protein
MRDDGAIADAPGETWLAVQTALERGRRGLPGGSSLAALLAEHRGVRNHMDLPRLSIKQILAWADAHHTRTGTWPRRDSGPVADARSETWGGIDTALKSGVRPSVVSTRWQTRPPSRKFSTICKYWCGPSGTVF